MARKQKSLFSFPLPLLQIHLQILLRAPLWLWRVLCTPRAPQQIYPAGRSLPAPWLVQNNSQQSLILVVPNSRGSEWHLSRLQPPPRSREKLQGAKPAGISREEKFSEWIWWPGQVEHHKDWGSLHCHPGNLHRPLLPAQELQGRDFGERKL